MKKYMLAVSLLLSATLFGFENCDVCPEYTLVIEKQMNDHVSKENILETARNFLIESGISENIISEYMNALEIKLSDYTEHTLE
jgi:hypothetical protein